jgi:hypothetical protein
LRRAAGLARLDLRHRHGVAGEPLIDHLAAAVAQRRARRLVPQRLAAAAGAFFRVVGERIDLGFIVPDGEMQVRKLGVAGKPDAAERRAGLHLLAAAHADTLFRHVAILRDPTALVPQHDAVAALAALDRFACAFADRDIGDAVARADHGAGRCGNHVDAGALRVHAGNADIGAVVAVIGLLAAAIVLPFRRGVAVRIILQEAGLADLAGQRQREADRIGGAGSTRVWHEQNCGQDCRQRNGAFRHHGLLSMFDRQ